MQATLMRATIHVVSKRDYWPFAVAIRGRSATGGSACNRPRPQERELQRRAAELDALLAEGPRRHDELAEVLGSRWGVGPWLELVRVPPSGTWEKRRAHLFQTAERWVGPEDVGPEDGARSSRGPVPRRLRAGVAHGHRQVGWHEAARRRTGTRAAGATAIPRRGRRGTPRPSARAAAASRHARARAFPSHLGRRPPRPRTPGGRPPRGASTAHLPDDHAAVRRHVPRRRRRRRDVALRGRPHSLGAVRQARPRVPARGRRRGRATCAAPRARSQCRA